MHPNAAIEIDARVPVQGLGREPRDAVSQDGVIAERVDQARAKALPKGAERRHIHVIVVIVRNKDDVDVR